MGMGTPVMWGAFLLFLLGMLAVDLGIFHRRAHAVGMREAAAWSAVWVVLALAFNSWVWLQFGAEAGMQFLTGYVIEKALSVDNLFVFLVIFSFFAIRREQQHRVLFWGIVGALATRALFIAGGTAAMQRFHWMLYLFGAFLLFTGVRLLRERGKHYAAGANPMVRALQRKMPVASDYEGPQFTVVRGGRRYATPLLLALITVEATDVIFAVDSIPAVLAITVDPFLVFTSNVFAVLGLRSLYFLLEGTLSRFASLKVGLALVLVFVGGKMLLAEIWQIPTLVSLAVIGLLIGGSMLIPRGRRGVNSRHTPS